MKPWVQTPVLPPQKRKHILEPHSTPARSETGVEASDLQFYQALWVILMHTGLGSGKDAIQEDWLGRALVKGLMFIAYLSL
jgi:hypothetical protein